MHDRVVEQAAKPTPVRAVADDALPEALRYLSDAARDALYAVRARQRGLTADAPHTMPIALIGPREASDTQRHTAALLGAACGFAGLPVLCGGKSGVMEAGAAGVRSAAGIVIGLLPEDDADLANPYLSIALPTGLGITRNALIARAALCLLAVGGGLGTLSEMAFGRQWGKRVLTIDDAPDVAGAERFETVETLLLHLMTEVAGAPRNHVASA
jgi:uncharacterized protein (TIGR00725 family)